MLLIYKREHIAPYFLLQFQRLLHNKIFKNFFKKTIDITLN
uniref:Uncharacterized protein n=1 Tax=Siphoviridae sp. ctGz830 TaxID=2827825 RepID=A0A8S5T9J8_9CAUD|nr:MAG TPA: hypothetical protein [Siphoviridae sp. ctGz830]